jgi:hypothetical protein
MNNLKPVYSHLVEVEGRAAIIAGIEAHDIE